MTVNLRTKWHLAPFSRLATMHGPKSGEGYCAHPFIWRDLGPQQCRLGLGVPVSVRTKWYLVLSSSLATVSMAENGWGLCPFLGGVGELGPNLKVWLGPIEA